jgi:hypothetical protein
MSAVIGPDSGGTGRPGKGQGRGISALNRLPHKPIAGFTQHDECLANGFVVQAITNGSRLLACHPTPQKPNGMFATVAIHGATATNSSKMRAFSRTVTPRYARAPPKGAPSASSTAMLIRLTYALCSRGNGPAGNIFNKATVAHRWHLWRANARGGLSGQIP